MYCCIRCGRTKKEHMLFANGACNNYNEGGIVDYECRAGVCIHPINCKRNSECLSIKKEKTMKTEGPEDYASENMGDGKGRSRHGSPLFYQRLQKMAETHDRKSHDYASNDNPYGNYHFAGKLSKLFDNPDDAGFIGRLGEKFYRLANLENSKKEVAVTDEGVEDTENDICVITLLWMVDRAERRQKQISLKMQGAMITEKPIIKQDNEVVQFLKNNETRRNFKKELTALINTYGVDTELNMSDYEITDRLLLTLQQYKINKP